MGGAVIPDVLRVGDLRITPPLLLAPMAGLTHTALRRLILGLGGVGLLSTEMLSARALPEEPADHPFLLRHPEERPLSWQILVARPEEVSPALDRLHALGADAVDLNLGCPAVVARKRGGGAFLAADPPRARAVVREARRRTRLPLSAKIRLGERLEEGPLRDLCRMLEDEGADLITVHARLRGERYGRRPRWDWIRKVKGWVSIPVVGNGGIFSAGDARRCLREARCDGLMIGRGAARRPWVFARIARDLWGAGPPPPPPPAAMLYRRFVRLLEESFPPERRLGRLKEFTHHFSCNFPFGHCLASRVQSSPTVEEAVSRALRFFEENGSPWLDPASP